MVTATRCNTTPTAVLRASDLQTKGVLDTAPEHIEAPAAITSKSRTQRRVRLPPARSCQASNPCRADRSLRHCHCKQKTHQHNVCWMVLGVGRKEGAEGGKTTGVVPPQWHLALCPWRVLRIRTWVQLICPIRHGIHGVAPFCPSCALNVAPCIRDCGLNVLQNAPITKHSTAPAINNADIGPDGMSLLADAG